MRFAERVVMVTGAGRGIGAAVARAFAAEGARVAAIDIDDAAIKALAGTLRPEPLPLRADVTRAAGVRAAVDAIMARWGPVDILINNAGGFGTVRPETEQIHDEEWNAAQAHNPARPSPCTHAGRIV